MNLERLNININGAPAPGFAGSNRLFDDVAKRVGAPLPEEYMDFIRKNDGGCPEAGSFFLGDKTTANSFSVDWFYTFSNPALDNINAALDGWSKFLGKMALPIARDGGGNQFFLDLKDDVPSVWIYLHDANGSKVRLTDSFEDFLSALTVNPDFI